MSIVRPFAGLRPPKDLVLEVACPPYDVVNSKEARAYAAGKSRSFFHISRPEIDLPGVDEHAPEVYQAGVEQMARFRKEGTLVADPGPSFYLYRQTMGTHVQIGVVAAASAIEYEQGLIKKRELTRADKEEDRTRHIDKLNANDEPVFLTYPARASIDALVRRLSAAAPTYDFVTDDQIGHTFWVVSGATDIAALEAEFRAVPALYIADGHHRSAAATRVCQLRRKERGDRHTGNEEYNFFLAVIFPHDQMQILDYNRLVRDLNGLTTGTVPGVRRRALRRDAVRRQEADQAARFRDVPRRQVEPAVRQARQLRRQGPRGFARRLDPAGEPAASRARHQRPADRQAHRLRRRHPGHG